MDAAATLTPCFADSPPIAADVARGVTRLFCRQDLFAICEVPLPNGRRADMMAIDAKGALTIVEIKVSRADLVGDCKWTDYLEFCDRFFWAVPQALGPMLERECFLPERAGLIVAVQQRQPQTVRLLLEAGADPNKADHAAGYSARDYAKQDRRTTELLKLIDTVKPTRKASMGPSIK